MKSFWDYKKKNLNEVVETVFGLLTEKKALTGSGEEGQRYLRKYIRCIPEKGKELESVSKYIQDLKNEQKGTKALEPKRAKQSPLVLNRNTPADDSNDELPEGSFLVPYHDNRKTGTLIGKTLHSHFHVYDKDGKYLGVHQIPHTHVRTNTNLTYRYNYEMGIVRLYNYIMPKVKGKNLNKDQIKTLINKEITKSLSKKDHPLSFYHKDANPLDFSGGIPKVKDKENWQKAFESHNQSFTDAADLIADTLTNKDFEKNIQRGDKLNSSGKDTASHMSPLFLKCYGLNPDQEDELPSSSRASKGDARTITFVDKNENDLPGQHHKAAKIEQRAISLKKGSAQLTSNGPQDSEALLRASTNDYFRDMLLARHKLSYDKHFKNNAEDRQKLLELVTHNTNYDSVPKDAKGRPITNRTVTLKDTDALLNKEWPEDEEARFAHASNLISHFRAHMENGRNLSGSDSKCLEILKNLETNMPRVGEIGADRRGHPNYSSQNRAGFTRLVNDHAASGKYKFKDHVGTASHMGETGKGGRIRSIQRYMDLAEHSGQLKIADKAAGEEGEGDTKGIRVGPGKHPKYPHHSMRAGTPKSKLFREDLLPEYPEAEDKTETRSSTRSSAPASVISHTDLQTAAAAQHAGVSGDFATMTSRIASTRPSRIQQPVKPTAKNKTLKEEVQLTDFLTYTQQKSRR